MRFGKIPGLAKPVSKLILGSVYFHCDQQAEADAVLDRFLEKGGNTIDTAHCYGENASVPLGNWMKSRGNRNEVVILDKGCHPYGSPRMTATDLLSDLETDLQRLGTDHVDIWMFHRDDPSADLSALLNCLHDEIDRGRIAAIGGSNWTPDRLEEANRIAENEGLTPLTISSPNLCLADANEPMWDGCVALDQAGREWHAQTQMPVFAWSSVARGFFAGFEDDDVRRVFHNPANFARLDRTIELACKLGVKPVQVALAWTLDQPFPVHALIGCRTPEEVDDAVEAFYISLTREQHAWLREGKPGAQ